MLWHVKWLIFLRLIHLNFTAMSLLTGIQSSYLNVTCIRCLCHVNGCDMLRGCTHERCGPFMISKDYWNYADKPTLPYDDPKRAEAFEDCANDYHCSVKSIKNYIGKFAKDCSGDGIIDCFDYVMMNFYQEENCFTPLFLSSEGLRILERYEKCGTLKEDVNLFLAKVNYDLTLSQMRSKGSDKK